MAFDAKAIEVMIASPADVVKERGIVREVIAEWNTIYARSNGAILLPMGWETHSSPELSGRPQQMINERLLAHADILVGIFWTRVGSPTGKAISGSVEEIERHMAAGKPVMLYFSSVPVVPGSYDQDQFQQLQTFRSWALGQGLVESFDSAEEFRAKFQRQLPLALNQNAYVKQLFRSQPASAAAATAGAPEPTVTPDDYQLLKAAADSHGTVLVVDVVGGTVIQSGEVNFGDGTPRDAARWKAVVRKLNRYGLLVDNTGEGKYFEVTDAGYRLFDS
jgi:hypothetical protein